MKRLARLFTLLLLLFSLAIGIGFIWLPPLPQLPPEPSLPPLVGSVERIVVEKGKRQMTLYQNGQPVRRYNVALGFAPEGNKDRQGDGRTPEGEFRIDRRNDKSAYHLSLGLDYPKPEDRARAAAGGYDPGGDIFIHGQPNSLPDALKLAGDWTAGCIALTNSEIREIWEVVPTGTPVEILP
jgi:murein L,D-transpeptidase YafK